MRDAAHRLPFAVPRSEIVLRLPNGSPWRLTMTAGCERFVGYYPRLPGIEADGPILSYQPLGRVAT